MASVRSGEEDGVQGLALGDAPDHRTAQRSPLLLNAAAERLEEDRFARSRPALDPQQPVSAAERAGMPGFELWQFVEPEAGSGVGVGVAGTTVLWDRSRAN